MLKQGLLELMHIKKFKDISIKDITERMDLNRGTFYLHYADTIELLQSIENDLEAKAQELIDKNCETATEEKSVRPILEPILDFVIEEKDTCFILFDNNEVSGFTLRLQKMIMRNKDRLMNILKDPMPDSYVDYFLSYSAYGLIGVVGTWFSSGGTLPKEELIQMADDLILGAASRLV